MVAGETWQKIPAFEVQLSYLVEKHYINLENGFGEETVQVSAVAT